MFRLRSIRNQDKEDVFVNLEKIEDESNYYTVITGENGCGKSSLLSKAINTFIFDNFENSKECTTESFSEKVPSRVIAICNARYNRFTSMRTYLEQSKVFYPNFYIHNEDNLEVSRSLQSIMHSVVRESIVLNNRDYDIYFSEQRRISGVDGVRTAFEMIGIQPVIDMKLEFNKTYISAINRVYRAEQRGDKLNQMLYGPYTTDHVHWRKILGVHENVINDLFELYESAKKRANVLGGIEINIANLTHSLNSNYLPDKLLEVAIAVGFVIPTKLKVQRINSLKWVSIHNLSSGQQSLMMNAVIISTFTKKDALICIDEPENSLHPEWQLNYMAFIDHLCPKDIGCHLLVSTHSPQIISGVKSSNGCVVSLTSNMKLSKFHKEKLNLFDFSLDPDTQEMITDNQEIHSISSFLRQSADRQLIEIFKSPGFGNESLIHRLMLILSKQTKKIKLKPEDEIFIGEIYGFIKNGKLDKHDPATVIFKQIMAFRDQRTDDDKKSS
ncbi:AAA family ATPase [Pantoea ananatis]|uniref:AAA family ATPase n=1 Tax=Pantoea ananas TaxID=553 RepID=UPI0002D5F918|nr:AAA family ATPase [Pantoea ananatis]